MIFKPISNMAVVTIKFLVYGSMVAIIIILLIAKGPKEVGTTGNYTFLNSKAKLKKSKEFLLYTYDPQDNKHVTL